MAFASHIVTVRRLKKYIDDVIGKKANLPDTSKTIIGNISQINSNLTDIGVVYNTTTLLTTSIPATTETTVLRLSDLPKGVYMASTYCGTNSNNVSTGIIGIKTTNNQNVFTPIGNSGYRFNGSVANVFKLTADTNTVSVILNVEKAITLQWGRLTVVRIA